MSDDEFDDFRPKRNWNSKKNKRNLDKFDHHRKVAIKRAKMELHEDDDWLGDSLTTEDDTCVSEVSEEIE